MSDHEEPVDEALLADIVERITALSPAYLYTYFVPRLPAWEAEATLTCAVVAAARRAVRGQVGWPAADVRWPALALCDRAPEVYAVLTALLEELEEPGPRRDRRAVLAS